MISRGSSCAITHDIVVGGEVAFQADERVTVEMLLANPRMPENIYVVASAALNQRFQLNATDLRELSVEPTLVFSGPEPPMLMQPRVPEVRRHPGKAPARRNSTRRSLLMAIGLIIGLIVIYSILSATERGSSDKKGTTPAASGSWQTVYRFSGDADRRSEGFRITTREQRLSYNIIGGDTVMCEIYVMQKGASLESEGGTPEATLATAGPGDRQLAKEPGEYYLDVKAANCQWTVTVRERR